MVPQVPKPAVLAQRGVLHHSPHYNGQDSLHLRHLPLLPLSQPQRAWLLRPPRPVHLLHAHILRHRGAVDWSVTRLSSNIIIIINTTCPSRPHRHRPRPQRPSLAEPLLLFCARWLQRQHAVRILHRPCLGLRNMVRAHVLIGAKVT